jgi:ketosteroid isomerase-like protein
VRDKETGGLRRHGGVREATATRCRVADVASAGKDIEKIISYWTDDAVVMEPGQPAIEGRHAIRAFVTASVNTPGFKIH